MTNDDIEYLANALERDLLTLYGSPVLSGDNLRAALGYSSLDALRQAMVRDTVPVKLFSIKFRRGKHALVKDIALWLATEARQFNQTEDVGNTKKS